MLFGHWRIGFVSALGALVATACGGSSDSDVASTPAASACGALCATMATTNCAGFSEAKCRNQCEETSTVTCECAEAWLDVQRCYSRQPPSAFLCGAGNVYPNGNAGSACEAQLDKAGSCLAEMPDASETDFRTACQRMHADACPDPAILEGCRAVCVLNAILPCPDERNALYRCAAALAMEQFDCSTNTYDNACTTERAAYSACAAADA